MVLATQAKGQSMIREMIFENRYMHVPELSRMGADIHVDGRTAIIRREAREDRSLLVLAADGDLEPALAERLTALCRRAR